MGNKKGKLQSNTPKKRRMKGLLKIKKEPYNSSKNTESKDSTLLKWLKPFLQVIAIIISIFAAYVAYKSYTNTIPVQITLEYYGSKHNYAINNDRSTFIVLDRFYGDWINFLQLTERESSVLLPTINNYSEKSIKNFNLKVGVLAYPFKIEEESVNQDFVINKKESEHQADFEYKYDVLHAYTTISSPLDALYLDEDKTYDENYYMLFFDYSITYEGAPNPIQYRVVLYASLRDNNENDDTVINEFLDVIYDTTFHNPDNYCLISICSHHAPFTIIDLISEHVDSADFESFKSMVIKDYNYIYDKYIEDKYTYEKYIFDK